MQHDPVRVTDTKAWLMKAADDLQAAHQLLTGSPKVLGAAVFHCQQAAEKVMKGFLAWHDVPFRKTHDLEEIGAACIAVEPTLKPIVDRAVPLTEYAWRFRYPGEPESPGSQESQEAFALAREVYDTIVLLLPKEVRGR